MTSCRRHAGLALVVLLVLMVPLIAAIASNVTSRDDITLSFTFKNGDEAKLPVKNSFTFDGTTSDIARQLYLRHVAGDSIDKVVPNTIPTAITTRLSPFNISFENLPGLLQRALLWDSGYVISPENNAVQIWTLGGRSMATLAVSKVEFDATGCTAINCSQPDNTTYHVNKLCTGTKMLTVAKCLMDTFESDTSSYTAMWSNGGAVDMVPEIRAVMHGWIDSSTDISYLLSAVHSISVDLEPAYGTCNVGGYGSLVVPCYLKGGTSADDVGVMSVPIATPWVTTWIKQYQPTMDTALNVQSSNDSGFHVCLLVLIIIAAVLVVMFVVFAVCRKPKRARSNYWRRDSTAGSNDSERRQNSSSLVPLAAQVQGENSTSLGRTEEERLGGFNQTLCLPREDDSPNEEISPVIEGILPRPRRHTAPVSSISAARGTNSSVERNTQTNRSSTVLGAQGTALGAQTQASAHYAPIRSRTSFGQSLTPASRQSIAVGSTFAVCRSSVGTSTEATNSSSSRTATLARRSNSEVHYTRSSTRNYVQAAQAHSSTPTSGDLVPSIRNPMQADQVSTPARRDTFRRYSAADSVQYTLTTDPNLIGKRITWERIELGSLLSRGAYGEVWACRYAGKQVAVKRLLQSKDPTFQATENFTNEIQLTASLNHPNIVRFIGVTWSSLENLAMVIEYLPRGDMQKYLQRNGDLITWARDKLDMAIGVAKALAYLHSREIIHRDIKARNVLLTKRLQPKLIDFGASRLSAPSEMSAGIGTPFWTAPEVLESTEYTVKADIYSFGVLLSELDTCKAPYYNLVGADGEKMKPFYILTEVVDSSLRPSLSKECPQRIRKAADACFQHNPNLRPSALELIKLLDS